MSGLRLVAYPVLYALAFVIGFVWLWHGFHRTGLRERDLYGLAFFTLVGTVGGAHLLSLIFYDVGGLEKAIREPARLVHLLKTSGTMFFGGFVGGLAGSYAYARIARIPLPAFLDLAAPPLALGASIGRIGCLAAGCCRGRPIHFLMTAAVPGGEAELHPTQLYASAADAAILMVLLDSRRRVEPDGVLFASFVALYSVKRLLLEPFRDNPPVVLGLTPAQLLAAPALVTSLVVIKRLRGRRIADG